MSGKENRDASVQNMLGTATAMLINSTLSADDKQFVDEYFAGSIFDGFTETVIIFVFSVLILTGFLFNAMMLVVILLSEKLRKMPFNLLLLNLCVSNILLSLFCMPFVLVGLIRRGWIFGPALCKIIPSVQGVGVCVSATTVTVIAVDRYISIVCRERNYSVPRTRVQPVARLDARQYNQVMVETFIIWVIGIACGLPVSVFQVAVTFPEYSLTYMQCIEEWPMAAKAAYSVTILLVQCVIPSVALVVTGSAITSHLKKIVSLLGTSNASTGNNTVIQCSGSCKETGSGSEAKNKTTTTAIIVTAATEAAGEEVEEENSSTLGRKRQQGMISSSSFITVTDATADSAPIRRVTASDYHQRNMERNQLVTRTLLAVSISFTACWMPLHILNALLDLGFLQDEEEHINKRGQKIYLLIAICSGIAMTSVPLNALLYGWYNPSINREVINWRLLGCCLPSRDNSHRETSRTEVSLVKFGSQDMTVGEEKEGEEGRNRMCIVVNSSRDFDLTEWATNSI